MTVYREGGYYLLALQESFQAFSIRSRCAKRRLTTESTLCACGSKLPLILSSLRVLPCSGSPRALETARECVRDWETARDGGRQRGGVEKFPITYLSTAPNGKKCTVERRRVGMAWFFLVLGWGKIGGGGLSLSARERKDVLGNSNKLARSFVGLELRSHC